MHVRFDHVEDVAKHIKTFWFRPKHPVQYVAGQYIQLHLPHPATDERGDKRWFTLSSSPTEPLLSITTKFADQPSSFKQTLAKLQPGTEIYMAEPMGDFVLPKDKSRPLVFVAGGMGITPLRSMVKWLTDTGEKRKIQLIYAATRLEDIVFTELFKSYGLTPEIVLSQPPADWLGHSERLNAAKILKLSRQLSDKLIYVSGPEPMVEVLLKDLEDQGIPKHQLIGDFFPGYPVP